MSDQTQTEVQSVLKRPRPVLSCFTCRRKKLKCDRMLPCQQCLKVNQPSLCTYAPGQEPELRNGSQTSDTTNKRARHDAPSEISHNNTDQINDLHDRVRRLEQALRLQQTSQSTLSPQKGSVTSLVEHPLSRGNSSFEEPYDASPSLSIVDENFSVFKKFEDAVHFVKSMKQRLHEPDVRTLSLQLSAIQRALQKSVAAQTSSDASFTNLTELLYHMVLILPAPNVRQKLIELYFEHFEHCSRMVHKPKFLSQNRSFNQGTLGQVQIDYFLPALVGVLFIASSLNTYPECNTPSLQGGHDGIDAVQLINSWYGLVVSRDGLTIPAIQVRLLAIQAQKYQNADAAVLWVSSAQLIRQAMIQGLHKEVPPHMSNYEGEIRRGTWLTLLEQDLALAISNEMPPLCPSYDLRPPANCDDHELSETSTANPPNYPSDQWTDGLCQHILGTTFNRRLEAYRHRFANRTSSHYATSMEHAKSLELILRELPPLFRLDYIADHAANTPGRLMAQMDLDIALRRPLIATYAPYARATPVNDMYREARIPWVQSHLIAMCFQDLFDPQFPAIDVPRPIGYWNFFYTAYRYDVIQSLEAMLVEAHHLRQVESMSASHDATMTTDQVGHTPARSMRWNFAAMMKSIEDTIDPMGRRIGASGGDLRSFVRYNMLYDCLRTPYGERVDAYIMDGLRDLISSLRKRLEHEGYTIEPDSNMYFSGHVDNDWLTAFLSMED